MWTWAGLRTCHGSCWFWWSCWTQWELIWRMWLLMRLLLPANARMRYDVTAGIRIRNSDFTITKIILVIINVIDNTNININVINKTIHYVLGTVCAVVAMSPFAPLGAGPRAHRWLGEWQSGSAQRKVWGGCSPATVTLRGTWNQDMAKEWRLIGV